MKLLNERVAVITGSTKGNGRAIANLYSEQGANVVVTGRSPSELKIHAGSVESLTDLTLFRHSIGWQFEKGEEGNYWMIKNAGISGGLAPRENPEQMPTMFVAVESIAEYINKAQAAWSKSNQK